MNQLHLPWLKKFQNVDMSNMFSQLMDEAKRQQATIQQDIAQENLTNPSKLTPIIGKKPQQNQQKDASKLAPNRLTMGFLNR